MRFSELLKTMADREDVICYTEDYQRVAKYEPSLGNHHACTWRDTVRELQDVDVVKVFQKFNQIAVVLDLSYNQPLARKYDSVSNDYAIRNSGIFDHEESEV